MLERHGSDFSDAMRKLNPPTHLATMKRGAAKRTKESLNAKKMYEEVRRDVSHFLSVSLLVALSSLSAGSDGPPREGISFEDASY